VYCVIDKFVIFIRITALSFVFSSVFPMEMSPKVFPLVRVKNLYFALDEDEVINCSVLVLPVHSLTVFLSGERISLPIN